MSSRSRGKVVRDGRSIGAADDVVLNPKWPMLQPLVPTRDLWMEAVLQDQIILIRNLFTSSLCKNYVSFLSTLPLITTPATAKEGYAVRINDRFEVHDVGFSQRLWRATGLADVVAGLDGADQRLSQSPDKLTTLWGGELCGLNPRIRVYRYRKGQRFGPHCRLINLMYPSALRVFHLDIKFIVCIFSLILSTQTSFIQCVISSLLRFPLTTA
jgi:hypothetical protein